MELSGSHSLHTLQQAHTHLCCSISVLQWLLNAETSHPTSSPPHRLSRFFTTLHSALRNPSRAVFQFYPSSDDQIQLITSCALKAGFGGGLVVDYPNSNKAKKVFLCLFVGGGGQQQIPKGLGSEVEDDARARFERRRERVRSKDKSGKRKHMKDKDWILQKKEVREHLEYTLGVTNILHSCTGNVEKRESRMILSSQGDDDVQPSELIPLAFSVCSHSTNVVDHLLCRGIQCNATKEHVLRTQSLSIMITSSSSTPQSCSGEGLRCFAFAFLVGGALLTLEELLLCRVLAPRGCPELPQE